MRTLPYRWLGALLIILTVAAAGVAHGQPAPAPAPDGRPAAARTIVVTGQGTVEAVPDRAIIALAVIVVRPTAQDAQRESAAAMTQIVGKILALGLPQSAVRTTTVSLFPQRRPESGGTGPITGYQAENRVIVTLDDLSRAGQVIDTGVAAGANGVDGLEWQLRDPTGYRTQALRLAVQDARATATAIAEAAGVGGLRLVRIEQAGAIPVPRPGIAMAQVAAGTPVLPGTVPVVMQVRAVYTF